MADNQTAKQKLLLTDGFLDDQKAESLQKVLEDGINDVMLKSAKKFVDVWKRVVKEKKIVASGNIESNLVILPPENENGVTTLEIEFPYYAKFQDRGVKGLKKDPTNNSPYFFKTWGMSKEGQDSVREWLETAKGKVASSDAQKSQFGSETKFTKQCNFIFNHVPVNDDFQKSQNSLHHWKTIHFNPCFCRFGCIEIVANIPL